MATRRLRQLAESGVVEALSQPGPVLSAVRALVESYARNSLDDERRRGCMVVNAAVEMMARDLQAARRVEASWDTLETALTSALARARAQGEIPADKDPRALARFLLVMLQGLRVLGRAHPDEDSRHTARAPFMLLGAVRVTLIAAAPGRSPAPSCCPSRPSSPPGR
jgi:TetR/AcrR family transcriptional regulator, transcriptional repressor for nem operon